MDIQDITKREIIKDLFILTVVSIVIVLTSIFFDTYEQFINLIIAHENRELDEILISGGLSLLIGFIWFTWRRLQNSRKLNRMIRNSESKYSSLINSTDNSIYLVDRNYNYLFINENHLERLGAKDNQYKGQPFSAFHSPKETELFIEKAEKVFKAGKPMGFTYKSFKEDRYFLQTYSPVMGNDNEPVAITVISQDVTELKHMEEDLRALSLKDDLTGLYNRRGFTTLAEQYLKMARRAKKGFFMLYADLDNLKLINDKFGHQEGDSVLTQIATILTDNYRESDVISRIGGDEFAVLPAACDGDNIDILVSRLHNKINSHNLLSNHVYKITLSVGTAYFDPANPYSLEKLLKKADEAMYEQKKKKRTSDETPVTSVSK